MLTRTIRERLAANIPYLEYINSAKIALRPRRMIRADFPVHFSMEREITKYDTVLEVGANIGGNSKELGRLAKQVYSFEPSPSSFRFLKFNTRRVKNVTCFNAALSGKTEEDVDFNVKFGSGSLFNNQDFIDKRRIKVKVLGINDLPFQFNTMILDAEGAEIPILNSFEKWDGVDKVYCETHSINGHNTESEVRQILRGHYSEIYIDHEITGLYNWVIAKNRRPS